MRRKAEVRFIREGRVPERGKKVENYVLGWGRKVN